MSKIVLALIYFVSCISLASPQQAGPSFVYDPSFITSRSAAYLNEIHDWESLVSAIESMQGKAQADLVRNVLRGKVDMKAPFPKFTALKDKLIFAPGKFLSINKDLTFTFQGFVFRMPRQALDLYLKDAILRLESVSSFSLFDSAYAAPTYNSLEGKIGVVLAALTVVGIASLAIVSSGPLLAAAGIAAAVAGVAGLAVLVGNKFYQKAHRGTVECRGSEFYVRYQANDRLKSESAPIPHHEQIFPKDENGKALECTPERAATLQNIFTYEDSYINRLESQPSNPAAVE